MVVTQRAYEKDETEKRQKTSLTIEMKDFGPIAGGKITMRPLTLFVGPNNSGKSYAAMLIHSLFELHAPHALITVGEHSTPEYFRFFFSEYFDIPSLDEELSELKQRIDTMKKGEELEIPTENLIKKISKEMYEKGLSNVIIRSYACPLEELIRVRKKSFSLRISYDSHNIHLEYDRNKLKIKKYFQLYNKIRIRIAEMPINRFEIEDKENETLIEIDSKLKEENKKIIFSELKSIIKASCVINILENFVIPCYYLPASRAGILQSYKALAAAVVKKAPFVGMEKPEIPKFSGVIADFISQILTLTEWEGPFYELAQECERELIKGKIVIKKSDYRLPEIHYRFQETEIPLHRTSSTVSELAPLFLYLKYVAKPRSVLVIEEPEAHLHPENQRILAKFLVKLIRKGVNILITTHSDYLIEQLSSFILLSQVSPEKRVSKYGYTEEDFLNPDEVAAYVFNHDKQSDGYKISEIEITEEDGISQKEHMRIIEALYEETLKLRKDVTSET